MSRRVNVNISGPKNQKLCRCRFQCTQPPKKPSTRNTPARTACVVCDWEYASLSHCQRKYVHHMSICAVNGAWRMVTDGLPYCSRLKLYLKASHVCLLNVQSQRNSVRQPVGSPSLIVGKYAVRIGWTANGVIPSTIAPAHARIRRHRMIVRGRRITTASAAAGAAMK